MSLAAFGLWVERQGCWTPATSNTCMRSDAQRLCAGAWPRRVANCRAAFTLRHEDGNAQHHLSCHGLWRVVYPQLERWRYSSRCAAVLLWRQFHYPPPPPQGSGEFGTERFTKFFGRVSDCPTGRPTHSTPHAEAPMELAPYSECDIPSLFAVPLRSTQLSDNEQGAREVCLLRIHASAGTDGVRST